MMKKDGIVRSHINRGQRAIDGNCRDQEARPVTDRLSVLIAHETRIVREALATVLSQSRPDLDVRGVPSGQLDAMLTEGLDAIVVCNWATDKMQSLSRGWVVLVDNTNAAFVGTGDCWHTLRDPGIGELLTAIDDLAQKVTRPHPSSAAPT
jgi:hypothetical protein